MKKVLNWITVPVLPILFAGLGIVLTGCDGQKLQETSTAASKATTPTEQGKKETKQAYTVQDVSGAAVVKGRVLFTGEPVPAKKTVVDQDREVCGKEQISYPVRVEKGGIVDAVVWIEDIDRGKPFDFPPPVLDQKGCVYVPHIVLMQPGELKAETKDSVSHNIHTFADFNRNVNLSLNQVVQSATISLMRPERVNVRCDVHGWMSAFVVVAKNPYYAVTREGGQFELDQIPPGHYQLKVWQETLGEMEKEIVVEAGKPTIVEFNLEQKL